MDGLRARMFGELTTWRGRGKSLDKAVKLVWKKYLPTGATELTGAELDAFIGAQVDLLRKDGVTAENFRQRLLDSG
jgi:hypothetical protein